VTVWYTSDLHFGHQLVAGERGFGSPSAHDLKLISNWNKLVADDDLVWVLGDISIRPQFLHSVRFLSGRKQLITGNHDQVFPMHRDAYKHQPEWLKYFESIQPFARRKAAGVEFLMSHFPYSADSKDVVRFSQYRLKDEGMLLVHGHLHVPEKVHPDRPRQVHVGLDAWDLKPAKEDDVLDLLTLTVPMV